MRYRLRTLLILLAVVVPLVVAGAWWGIVLREADRKAMRQAYENAARWHAESAQTQP